MRTNLLVSLVAAVVFSVVPSFAQADLEASVPFDFYAGESVCPAGKYILDIDNSGLLWIIRDATGARRVVGSIPVGGGPNFPASKLVFRRYGDDHFLREVWVSGRPTGRQIRPRDREREMARNRLGVDVTVLAATIVR
jgi:hypothetical protein